MRLATTPKPFGFRSISVGGVLVSGFGSYQQLIEVSTINFDLMSDEDQARVLGSFENFLNAQTGDLQILVSTRLGLESAEQPIARRRFLVVLSCRLARPDLSLAKSQLRAQAEDVIAGLSQVGLKTKLLGRDETRQVLADFWDQNQPARIVERPKEIAFGRGLCRTLVVSGWPATASFGWLNALLNWTGNLDISYHYRPVDLSLAQSKLNRKVTELDSRQRQLQRKGRPEDSVTADALESAVELRQQIQRGKQKLFLVSLTLTVWADDQAGLEQASRQIEALLSSRLFVVQVALWQQSQALASVLPMGQNRLGFWRNLNSACAALTFPFIGSELADTGGILYGVNPANNSLVLVDRFSLANANSIIFAQSGAGKSYLAKVEILRQLARGVEVVIVDPEGEYQALAASVCGQIIRFQANQQVRLNLLDRQLWATEGKLPKVAEVVDLLDLLIGFESNDERLVADRLLGQLYQSFDSPVWADLVDLVKIQAPGLLARFEHFGSSSLGSVLGQPTNISLSGSLTVLALDDWPTKHRPALTLLFSVLVRSQAKNNLKKRLLVIDEGWLLLENPLAGKLLAGLVRRARKNYLGVCFISQQAEDFLSNPAGKTIASQSACKFLLRADSTAIKAMARQFRLSEVEQDFLLTAARGQALILAESKHATVQIVASEAEHPLITTDPAEIHTIASSKTATDNLTIKARGF